MRIAIASGIIANYLMLVLKRPHLHLSVVILGFALMTGGGAGRDTLRRCCAMPTTLLTGMFLLDHLAWAARYIPVSFRTARLDAVPLVSDSSAR